MLKQRHRLLTEQGVWPRRMVQGWFNYHAIPGNMETLETFRTESVRYWFQALRCRSRKHQMPWERFGVLADHWILKPKILQPHPNERFYGKAPR